MADTKTKEVEVKAAEPVAVKAVSQPDVSLVEEDDLFEEFANDGEVDRFELFVSSAN